jgi:tetratricopeptide (TPR) repeat protein
MKRIFLTYLILVSSEISFGQKTSDNVMHQKIIELIDQNKEDEALKLLDEWLDQRAENKEALFLRARILNNRKEYLRALTDFNKAVALDPENKEAHYNRGIVKYQLDQFQSAIKDFYHCMDLPQTETNTAYFKIAPNSESATGISTLSGMQTDIWNYIGLCYYQLSEFKLAIEAFDYGLETDRGNMDLLMNRALSLEKMGNNALAKTGYQLVLENNPDHELALLNLQRLSSSESELSELDDFISKFPDQSMGYENRGLFHFRMEDFQSAENDFVKAVELQPDNQEYAFNLALTEIKLAKYAEAEKILIDLSVKDPQNASVFFNLGNIRYKLARYDEAISYYTLSIAHDGENAVYLYNRALTYFENQQLEKACVDIEKAQAIEPCIGAEFQSKYCKVGE